MTDSSKSTGERVPLIPAFQEAPEGMSSRNVSNTPSSTTTSIAENTSSIEPGHMLGHGSSNRRPQDAHIVTPADIHAERSGINPPGTIDQKLHEQHVGERLEGENSSSPIIVTHHQKDTNKTDKQEHHHHPHPHGQGLVSGGGNIAMGLRKQ